MIVHKITPIVNQTAEILNLPPEEVAPVIKHALSSIKNYVQDPTKAGIRLQHFGVVRPHPASLTSFLKRLLSQLKDPTTPSESIPKIQEEFRRF